MSKLISLILLAVFLIPTYAADLTQKSLEKDMRYYYEINKQDELSINDRLYVLYGLQRKYKGTGVKTAVLKKEIASLEPLRKKKSESAETSDPIRNDLYYYYKVSEQVKLDVNDRLFVLYRIYDKYSGAGKDLTVIDEEIRKLNPQWVGRSKPVAYNNTAYTVDTPGGTLDAGIKPGDVLGISVYPMESFSGEVNVKNDGIITLPLVGGIQTRGLTTDKLTELLKERLVRYITNPNVTVIKHPFNLNRITVTGEVAAPGIYPYRENLVVADLISSAGGLTANANDDAIRLHREKITLKLNTKDFALKANDIVEIPPTTKKVAVLGAVNMPGDYAYHDKMALTDAIKVAGGNQKSAQLDKIEIYRKATETERVVHEEDYKKFLKGKSKLDFQLEPGDIVFIPKK